MDGITDVLVAAEGRELESTEEEDQPSCTKSNDDGLKKAVTR